MLRQIFRGGTGRSSGYLAEAADQALHALGSVGLRLHVAFVAGQFRGAESDLVFRAGDERVVMGRLDLQLVVGVRDSGSIVTNGRLGLGQLYSVISAARKALRPSNSAM